MFKLACRLSALDYPIRSLPYGDTIPLSIKLSRSYTVPRARLGWLLVCVGIITWLIFGRNADWASLRFLQRKLNQTNGVVTNVSDSGFTSGSEFSQSPTRLVQFDFVDHDGTKRSARSWTDSTSLRRDDQVRIEYAQSSPEICRIMNYRSAPLPLWCGLVLSFPLLGLYFIIGAVCSASDSWSDQSK